MQEHITAYAPIKTLSLIYPLYRRFRALVGGVGPLHCDRAIAGQHWGGGNAAALKLDTRILTGNSFKPYLPPRVSCSDRVAYSGRPINYPVYEKASNFRAKVQEFTGGGFEVVITSVNLQRQSDMAAMHLRRGPRVERKGDAESDQKSARKAKRTVRLKCKEMGADHLVTFTTRDVTVDKEALRSIWSKFTDNVSYHLKRKFSYVCVPERHPTNPGHWHLHAAIRGRLSAREMVVFRRCWYIALGGKGNEKGSDAPGGFNIKLIRVRGGAHRRMDKIASYISKYITKELCSEFNKKRYWASKIDLIIARAYWLKSKTLDGAYLEFLKDFDCVPSADKNDLFKARNIDLIWMRFCPDDDAVPSVVPF